MVAIRFVQNLSCEIVSNLSRYSVDFRAQKRNALLGSFLRVWVLDHYHPLLITWKLHIENVRQRQDIRNYVYFE